ncbi:unnamed protein product [Pedinophyceae sp. YPF-701]|nr:unnamed protein product [Pedinophyceae sp. YPF-701]
MPPRAGRGGRVAPRIGGKADAGGARARKGGARAPVVDTSYEHAVAAAADRATEILLRERARRGISAAPAPPQPAPRPAPQQRRQARHAPSPPPARTDTPLEAMYAANIGPTPEESPVETPRGGGARGGPSDQDAVSPHFSHYPGESRGPARGPRQPANLDISPWLQTGGGSPDGSDHGEHQAQLQATLTPVAVPIRGRDAPVARPPPAALTFEDDGDGRESAQPPNLTFAPGRRGAREGPGAPPAQQPAPGQGGFMSAMRELRAGPSEDQVQKEAARRRTYAEELEDQIREKRARDAREKAEREAAEVRHEQEFLAHQAELLRRKQMGGGGEPMRDATGNVHTRLRGAAAQVHMSGSFGVALPGVPSPAAASGDVTPHRRGRVPPPDRLSVPDSPSRAIVPDTLGLDGTVATESPGRGRKPQYPQHQTRWRGVAGYEKGAGVHGLKPGMSEQQETHAAQQRERLVRDLDEQITAIRGAGHRRGASKGGDSNASDVRGSVDSLARGRGPGQTGTRRSKEEMAGMLRELKQAQEALRGEFSEQLSKIATEAREAATERDQARAELQRVRERLAERDSLDRLLVAETTYVPKALSHIPLDQPLPRYEAPGGTMLQSMEAESGVVWRNSPRDSTTLGRGVGMADGEPPDTPQLGWHGSRAEAAPRRQRREWETGGGPSPPRPQSKAIMGGGQWEEHVSPTGRGAPAGARRRPTRPAAVKRAAPGRPGELIPRTLQHPMDEGEEDAMLAMYEEMHGPGGRPPEPRMAAAAPGPGRRMTALAKQRGAEARARRKAAEQAQAAKRKWNV